MCVLVFAIAMDLLLFIVLVTYHAHPSFGVFDKKSQRHGCHFVSERSLSMVCEQYLEEMSMGDLRTNNTGSNSDVGEA